MREKIETDDVGKELIESFFVYKNEYAEARMYQCAHGHLKLCMSKVGYSDDADDHAGKCSRADRGGPVCNLPMRRYIPDDEGLDALGWAKRALQRESTKRENARVGRVRLEKKVEVLKEALERIASWDPPGSDSAANWLSAVCRGALDKIKEAK